MTTETIGKLKPWLGSMAAVLVLAVLGGAVVARAPLTIVVALSLLTAALCARKRLQPLAISAVVMLSLCELYLEVGGRTVRPETLLISILFVGVMWPFVTGQRRLEASPLYLPLFIFVAIVGCSLLVGVHQPVSAEDKLISAVSTVRVALAYLVFVIAFNFNGDPERKVSAVINAILLFSFVSCGVALLQILYHQGMLPFGLPSVLTERQAGTSPEWGREIFGPFIGQTGAHEFARMLSLQALTVFCVALVNRSRLKKILWICYFGLIVLILVRISVRVALLSLFAACCAVFVLERRTFLRKYISVFVIGGCALFVLHFFATHYFESYWLNRIRVSIPLISERGLQWQRGHTMLARFELWKIAWRMFWEHPVLGVGVHMYGPLSETMQSGLGFRAIQPHPHNGFIQVLCELGFVGLTTFLWLGTVAVREIVKARRRIPKSDVVRVADALLLGMLVWLVAVSIPGAIFLLPKDMSLFWVVLGVRLCYDYRNAVVRPRDHAVGTEPPAKTGE